MVYNKNSIANEFRSVLQWYAYWNVLISFCSGQWFEELGSNK